MLLNTLILIHKNVQFVKRIQLLKLQHKWEILIGFFMMQIFVPFRSVSTFIRIYFADDDFKRVSYVYDLHIA